MTYEVHDKTVLVTGATGFIGRHLAARLVEDGVRIRAFVRSRAKAADVLPDGASVVEGDVLDGASVERACEGASAVIHLANVIPGRPDTSARGAERANVTGTRNVAEAARKAGVERFLHVSSVAVFGPGAEGMTDERSPHRPGNDVYGRTKEEGEGFIRDMTARAGLPAVIVQPAAIYGPHDQTWTLGPLDLMRKHIFILPGGGSGFIQPLWISELVDGVVAAVRRGSVGESYILAGPQLTTIRDYFEHLASFLGRRIPSVPLGVAIGLAGTAEFAARLLGRPPLFTTDQVRYVARRTVFDIEKASRDLGFVPRIGLDEGMRRLEIWLREADYI